METKQLDLIIVGAGYAGMKGAVLASKRGIDLRIIDTMGPGGALAMVDEVLFSEFEGKKGMEVSEAMAEGLKSRGITVDFAQALELNGDSGQFILSTDQGSVGAKAILAASGTSPLVPDWAEEFRGKGVSTCAPCDAGFFRGHPVAVIGGGDQGLEEALYLADKHPAVHLIYPGEEPSGSEELQNRLKAFDTIVQHRNQRAYKGVKGRGMYDMEKLTGIVTQSTLDSRESILEVEAAFLAMGASPNSQWIPPLACDGEGWLVAGPDGATVIPGLYAVGGIVAGPGPKRFSYFDPVIEEAIDAISAVVSGL